MKLSRTELALLRLSDGIASPSDIERLQQSVSETEFRLWQNMHAILARTLRPSTEDAAELVADTVMNVLNSEQNEGAHSRQPARSILQQVLLDPQPLSIWNRLWQRLRRLDKLSGICPI